MVKSFRYIRGKAVRRFIHSQNKKVSSGFLVHLDDRVQMFLEKACNIHNGGKKVLDIFIANITKL